MIYRVDIILSVKEYTITLATAIWSRWCRAQSENGFTTSVDGARPTGQNLGDIGRKGTIVLNQTVLGQSTWIQARNTHDILLAFYLSFLSRLFPFPIIRRILDLRYMNSYTSLYQR